MINQIPTNKLKLEKTMEMARQISQKKKKEFWFKTMIWVKKKT